MKEVQELIQIFNDSTIEEQVKIRDSVYELKNYIDKYFHDTLHYCGHCYKHFPIETAKEEYEVWEERICTNPLSGYLDDYEYELRTCYGFKYYCPLCGEELGRYFQKLYRNKNKDNEK